VCYVGGRQYFNDPRVGDFSITFSTKDQGGEGLTGPIIQLAEFGDWQEVPVQDLSDEYQKYLRCKTGGYGCDTGPYVCQAGEGNWDLSVGRTRKWQCGIPKRGESFVGMD
jgi:hypothetical protein